MFYTHTLLLTGNIPASLAAWTRCTRAHFSRSRVMHHNCPGCVSQSGGARGASGLTPETSAQARDMRGARACAAASGMASRRFTGGVGAATAGGPRLRFSSGVTARLEPAAPGGGCGAVDSRRRAEGRDCRFPEMRCVVQCPAWAPASMQPAVQQLTGSPASGTSLFGATLDAGLGMGGMGGMGGGFGRYGAGGAGAASKHTSRRQFQGIVVVA